MHRHGGIIVDSNEHSTIYNHNFSARYRHRPLIYVTAKRAIVVRKEIPFQYLNFNYDANFTTSSQDTMVCKYFQKKIIIIIVPFVRNVSTCIKKRQVYFESHCIVFNYSSHSEFYSRQLTPQYCTNH